MSHTTRIHEAQKLSVVEWRLSDLAGVYSLPHHEANAGQPQHKTKAGRSESWYGNASQDDIERLLTDGWPEGAARLAKLSEQVSVPALKTRRRVGVWSREGSELSVERAMRGQWDTAWRTARRQTTVGPQTVELYCMYGGSAFESAESLFWQGAVTAALADMLEGAGYNVRITGCFMHGGPDWKGWLNRSDVIVKDSSEPMQLDSIAAILCHAGLYRTFLFQSWMQIPRELNTGLGPIPSGYRWNQSEIARMREAGELAEGGILIEPVRDRSSAEAELQRALKLLSIEQAA